MIRRNLIWNLLGEGLPMLAALVSVPALVGGVGMERFSALTLVWALLGYLMVLDLGLARSLVQIVAEQRGRDDMDGVAAITVPALALMGLLGIVTGGAVALASGPVAAYLVSSSPALAGEIQASLLILAAFVPVALVSAGLRGVLEAHQEFRRINQIKIAVGTANYLSPLVVLPFTDSLTPVVAAIAVGRLVGMLAFARLCLSVVPGLLSVRGPRPPLRPLFTMGAWTMLNNLLGPLMTYADRFVLASLVPMATLAYYTTPFEIVSRLLFIPAALSGVLFPVSAGLFQREPAALKRILEGGGFLTAGLFLAVQIGVGLLGAVGLRLWLGPEFARNSAPLLSILALGIFFNALAYIPYSLIHGVGRMDVTARLQLVEIPMYFLLLWTLVGAWGLTGAAVAWTIRTGCDLLLLLTLLPRLVPETRTVAWRLGILAVAVCGVAVLGLGGGVAGAAALAAALGLCMVCASVLHWGGFMC